MICSSLNRFFTSNLLSFGIGLQVPLLRKSGGTSHHLQVELVRRWRAGQDEDRVQTGIHISINGIAAGLRNTG